MDLSCGTSLAGYLKDTTYTQLVNALGEPTFPFASGDDKVQKEWVIEFKGESNPFRSTNYEGKPSVRVEEFIEHIKFLVHLEDTKSELGLGNLEN